MHWREAGPAAAHCGGDPFGVDPVMLAPELLGAMVYMLVGDSQDLEIDAGAPFGEELADCGSEASGDHVLFDGHEAGDTSGERQNPLFIERLREARVHDGRLETVAREDLRSLHRSRHRMAVGEDRDAVALAERLRHADRDRGERRIESGTDAGSARKAQTDRAAFLRGVPVRGPDHLTKLGLVLRGHERHARENPQIRYVVEALM